MRKGILSLGLIFLINTFSAQAFAKSEYNPCNESKKISLEKKKYEARKNDKLKVIVDGHGIFAVTYSDKVTNPDEIELLRRDVLDFTTQGTQNVNGNNKKSNIYGELEQYFTDTVNHIKPVANDHEITVDGEGFSYWYGYPSQPIDKRSIVRFTSVQDNFTFNYSQVTNKSTEVTTSVNANPTSPEIGGSVSTSWNIGYTSATYTIPWPDLYGKTWYGKTYGTIYLKTKKITGFTRNSSAIAVIKSGDAVYCNAYASK